MKEIRAKQYSSGVRTLPCSRASSPGARRGDIPKKQQTIKEMRPKRHSSRDLQKGDVQSRASKFSPPHVSRSKRVVSLETINILSIFPAGEMADPCNESLEDLVKKVKQRAKDAQHRQSLNESSLPSAYRKDVGQLALPNTFHKRLEW
jgi:hypothetical protein